MLSPTGHSIRATATLRFITQVGQHLNPECKFSFRYDLYALGQKDGEARSITQPLFCARMSYAFYFALTSLYKFFLPLLNLRSLIFGVTPYSCLRSLTLTPHF